MVPTPYVHYAFLLSQTIFFVIWIGFLLFHITILSPLLNKLKGEGRVNFSNSLYSRESKVIRSSGIIVIIAGILGAMYPEISLRSFISVFGYNGVTISIALSLVSFFIAGEAGLISSMGKYRKIAQRVIREPIGFVPAHLLALEKRIAKLCAVEAVITIAALFSLIIL